MFFTGDGKGRSLAFKESYTVVVYECLYIFIAVYVPVTNCLLPLLHGILYATLYIYILFTVDIVCVTFIFTTRTIM